MPAPRRIGSATSETRALILDAAERLVVEQGYTGVTSRSVAALVGINPGLVHYYFPTLDDLVVAVFRRGAEKNLERMAAALASPEPLRALWRFLADPRGAGLVNELMAAANQREVLHTEIAALAQRARRMQIEALRELLPQYDLDEERFPPALVAAAIQGLALLVVREADLEIETEHQEAAAAMEALLDDLEARRHAPRRRRT